MKVILVVSTTRLAGTVPSLNDEQDLIRLGVPGTRYC